MRLISNNLQQEIQNGRISNIIKIVLQNGDILGFTDNENVLTVDGVQYQPAPGLQRLRLTITGNAEVSNQEFGSAWLDVPESDLKGGLFDNAEVEVAWCSWFHPEYGKLSVFTGTLGEISWSDEGFKADVVNQMKNLELILGNMYTAQCRHSLFNTPRIGKIGACNVNPAAFTFTGSITSVEINKWKFTIDVNQPDKYFSNGRITFTSGLNNEMSYVVKVHTGNVIELYLPTSYVVSPGDNFTIYAGCDLTLGTCRSKFNNVVNFGGFPHIKTDANFS